MSLSLYLRSIVSLATLLLPAGQQLIVSAAPLKYLPDPIFSALSRKGTPKDISQGGGKRTVCLTRANPDRGLAAIVPPAGYGGLSTSANPAFWVYLPYATDRSISGVLSVRVADSFRSEPFIKVPVVLPSQPGLVRLKLPTAIDRSGLLAWTLTVVCDEENPSRNPFISGLVMVKTNPELVGQVAGLSPSVRVVEFARFGYWYDALDLVARTDGEVGVQRLMQSADGR
jgi:Domain of Unknown Function (DUF928)